MNGRLDPGRSSGRFRLAIIGAGLITRNSHLPTALSLPEVEVCALVDPALERARELVADYGLAAETAASVKDLAGGIDGAIVATPNHTHAAIAVPLLEAGISTLIEKPLATTVEEGRAIVQAAERGRAFVALGHHQRFLDAPRLLKRLLAEGYFGRVRRFHHQFGTAGGWPALSAYTLRREMVGGGVLVVTGTHFLDRMLDLWGMPDEVEVTDDAGTGPEAHIEARIVYGDAAGGWLEGTVRYSKCVSLPAGLVLDTERGTVILRDGQDDCIVLVPQGRSDLRHEIRGCADTHFPRGYEPGQRMLWDFVDACRSGRAPEVDGTQGLRSLELLQRCYARRQPLADHWARHWEQRGSPAGASA